MGRQALGYKEYVASGVWKCSDSPTNAHHWIGLYIAKHIGMFYCKWCRDTREFPTSWSRANDINMVV